MLIVLALVLVVVENLLTTRRIVYAVVAAEVALLLWVALAPGQSDALPFVLPILLGGHLIASVRGRRWRAELPPR